MGDLPQEQQGPEDENDYKFPTHDWPPSTPQADRHQLYIGHGTAVAAVAVGKTIGVASQANLVMVRTTGAVVRSGNVNPDNKYTAGGHRTRALENAFEWILTDIQQQRQTQPNFRPVINLSVRKSSNTSV